MKKHTILFLGFIFLSVNTLTSQEFQGQAIYQSKTVFEMKLDSSRIPPEQQKRFQDMIKKQFEKTYELNFNKTASIYKEQAKLEQPGGQGGMRFMSAGSANGLYYKDTKDHTYANQTELFGKNFLVKDDLPKLDWKLEKESKMIGNYLCFKATALRKSNDSGFRFGGPRRGNNKEKEDTKKDTLPKMTLVTAWYTPQIPVSQGPNEFWGLPGLILEVNYDKTMLLCTKIVLNPKDKKVISIPDNGKEVTQAEYDKIMKKKMKEMQDRYGGGQRKGDKGGHFRMISN